MSSAPRYPAVYVEEVAGRVHTIDGVSTAVRTDRSRVPLRCLIVFVGIGFAALALLIGDVARRRASSR